jgi:hypothetical protein
VVSCSARGGFWVLGVVMVAFSPHLFVWKRTDISVLFPGVNFACGRKFDLTVAMHCSVYELDQGFAGS